MGKTADEPYNTLFAFGTPFREIDNGGRAEGATNLPKIGYLAIRDTSAFTNGFQLLATEAYGSDQDGGQGDLYIVEIMPKHPQSTTAYDKSTALVDGDFILVHKLEVGDEFWVAGDNITFTEGDILMTHDDGTVIECGDGTSTPPGHAFIAMEAGDGVNWAHVIYRGVTSIGSDS